MSAPKRLLDDPTSELDVTLLESGLDEPPPPRLLGRTLVTLGVTSAALASASAGSAAVVSGISAGGAGGISAGGVSAGSTAAAKIGGVLSTTLAKWVVAVAVTGSVVTGGGLIAERSFRDPAPEPVAVVQTLPPLERTPEVVGPQAQAPAGAADPAPPLAVDDTPVDVQVPPTPLPPEASSNPGTPIVSLAPSAVPKKRVVGALTEEIAMLDDAHQSLRAGDARGCLVKLQAYSARFPKGQLASDAADLRARAAAAQRASSTVQ